MNGGDTSITGSIVSTLTLVCLNWLVSSATFKSKKIAALIEGQPQVLIHNGKLNEAAMQAEKLTHHELMAALREAGCSRIDQVHTAILENNGHISVQLKREDPKQAMRDPIEQAS